LLNLNCVCLATNLQKKMAGHHRRCVRQSDDHCKRSKVGTARPCREAM
jgi:hypothetical protein